MSAGVGSSLDLANDLNIQTLPGVHESISGYDAPGQADGVDLVFVLSTTLHT